MSRRSQLWIVLALFALAFASTATAKEDKHRPTTGPSKEDTKFLEAVIQGVMLDVAMGQVATTQASSAEVQAYGQEQVNDHSKELAELQALAAAKGVTLTTDLDKDGQKTLAHFERLSGQQFDRQYIEDFAIPDHIMDIRDYLKELRDTSDADISAFLQRWLPVLQVHLDQAIQISKDLNLQHGHGHD